MTATTGRPASHILGGPTEGTKLIETWVEGSRLPDDFPVLKISETAYGKWLDQSPAPENLRDNALEPQFQQAYHWVLLEAKSGRLSSTQAPEATRLLRVRYPFQDFESSSDKSQNPDIQWLRILSATLEELKVFPQNFAQSIRGSDYVLNVYPPAFYLKMLGLRFGADPMEIVPSLRWSTRGEMLEMAEAGQRPLILSPRREGKVHFYETHPATAATHDLFHIMLLSQIPRYRREGYGKILNVLRLRGYPVGHEAAREDIVERLLDGEIRMGPKHYAEIFSGWPEALRTPEQLQASYIDLDAQFQGHPQREFILGEFRDYFARQKRPQGESAP